MTDTTRIRQLAGWFYTRLTAARYSHNKIIDGSVTCLWQTPAGILYWHEYVPMRMSGLSENDKQIRSMLLAQKEGRYAMFFAKELGNALKILSKKEKYSHFLLIRIPRSTVGLESGLTDSITILTNTVLNGISVTNYSNYLIRNKNILPQHLSGSRTPPQLLKDSLTFTPDLSNRHYLLTTSLLVLVDDIVTSGKTLLVSRNLLIEKGIPADRIRMMAIARTVYRGGCAYPRAKGLQYY